MLWDRLPSAAWNAAVGKRTWRAGVQLSDKNSRFSGSSHGMRALEWRRDEAIEAGIVNGLPRLETRVHLDRAPGGDRHHWVVGGHAPPRIGKSQIGGQVSRQSEQPSAAWAGPATVRARPQLGFPTPLISGFRNDGSGKTSNALG